MSTVARVVLVESAPGAPGLLGHDGWSALASAAVVLLRDPATHPAALHLERAGIATAPVPDGGLQVRDRRDLLAPGAALGDRRFATGLVDLAAEAAGEDAPPVTVLLGPGDEGLGRAVGLEAARRGTEVEWVFLAEMPAGGEVLRLVQVEQRLRDPDGGCPWDLEQDHASLAPYLVEETYEALEAIASGDDRLIVEELGDVLLQVVFHSQVGHDRRAFTIDDVARGIADKLVRRHPHVFADAVAEDADAVATSWEAIKAEEKPERDGPFDGVVTAQPSLPLTRKVLGRARGVGIAWPDAAAAAAQVAEELDEVLAATDDAARADEVGDLLHAVAALAATVDVDPDLALRGATARFRERVEGAVALARSRGSELADVPPEERRTLLREAGGRDVPQG